MESIPKHDDEERGPVADDNATDAPAPFKTPDDSEHPPVEEKGQPDDAA